MNDSKDNGVFAYDSLTYFKEHEYGCVWIDQLDNTYAVIDKEECKQKFNLCEFGSFGNFKVYLGCAINVEFTPKDSSDTLTIGTHKFYLHPSSANVTDYKSALMSWYQLKEDISFKSGLCEKFVDDLIKLTAYSCAKNKSFRIRVVL